MTFPMLDGAMRMARRGQPVIITPFTLAGAMAPVTMAGAVALSIAEALAAMALLQYINPGCPVGSAPSPANVDMKSGAPAFGTPEYMRATQMTGNSSGSTSLPDALLRRLCRQRAGRPGDVGDLQLALGGGAKPRTNMVYHAAGWLEGGLIASPEKFIMDCEVLQMIQRYFEEATFATTEDDLAFDAIREVGAGGHYFGVQHTQDRYQHAFYQPFVSDWRNYEAWQAGWVGLDRRTRAPDLQADPGRIRSPAMNGDAPGRAAPLRRPAQARGRRADRFLRRQVVVASRRLCS
jgi:trimethylamine--corrinoid protein Co-methyltransferase